MSTPIVNSIFIPETPGGTALSHLHADTVEQAWLNLLEEAKHMPYDGIEGFKARGYQVFEYVQPPLDE